MRNFRHLTPKYIKNRIILWWYQTKHPNHPWLTAAAIEVLSSYLRSSDIGIEFGSGRSTIWFAERVEKLTSIEHDPIWHKRTKEILIKKKLATKVNYQLHQKVEKQPDNGSKYVKSLEKVQDNSLDFALIDGEFRDYCAHGVISKLKPGGILIIDNVNWYLPSSEYAPNSKRRIGEIPSELWKTIHAELKLWRRIWTSNGVWDTAIFFKPTNK